MKLKGLTGNQLKVLAMIFMTVDHVGYLILDQYIILRYIGRLAMPIFAWMIAEGCYHTRSRFRYFVTVAAVAAGCQAVYWFVDKSLMQCILVTFSLSILLIYALDNASRKKNIIAGGILVLVFSGVFYICMILPQKLPGFHIDYGFFGVILPAAIYMGRGKEEKLFAAACCLTAIAMTGDPMQWYALCSLPFLCLYNGKRGKKQMKYLFYLYYPLHLAVIYGIAYLLKQ